MREVWGSGLYGSQDVSGGLGFKAALPRREESSSASGHRAAGSLTVSSEWLLFCSNCAAVYLATHSDCRTQPSELPVNTKQPHETGTQALMPDLQNASGIFGVLPGMARATAENKNASMFNRSCETAILHINLFPMAFLTVLPGVDTPQMDGSNEHQGTRKHKEERGTWASKGNKLRAHAC